MLNIQKYLLENNETDAFEYFKNVLFLDIRTLNGFTIFNYNMIDSPKDNLIVKECRGLILQNNTWKVFLLPFKKFMNYGEGSADNIDFSKAYVQTKEDGSLVSLWHDGNMWQVATRKNMYGDNTCNSFLNAFESEKTFRQLFFETICNDTILNYSILNNLNTDCTYTFELCTSYNRVIKQYEKDSVYLLSIRDRETLKEFTSEQVKNIAKELNIQTPQNYLFDSILTPEHLMETLGKFPPTDEGYVVCQQTENEILRVKLKNPRYVLLAHTKMSLSTKNFVELIFNGEIDEFVLYFKNYEGFVKQILNIFYEFLSIQAYEGYKLLSLNIESRKDKALYIKNLGIPSSYLFKLIDNPNISARQFWIESSKHNLDNFIKAVDLDSKLKEIDIPKLNLIENV